MLRPLHASLVRLALVAALAVFATSAAPAWAQESGSPAPPPDTLLTPTAPAPAEPSPPVESQAAPAPTPAPAQAGPGDGGFTFPLLFDLRSRDEIGRELDLLSRLRGVAQDRMVNARALQTRRKYDVDIKGTEIDAAKKRIDLAKKEKRVDDAKSLDGDRKRLEAQQDFLEKMRDRAGAEADFQQATLDYARAREAACQAELSVIALGDLSNADTRGNAAARAAQLKLNDALKARAVAGAALGDREKTLCDRRKATYDSWLRLGH